MERYAPTLLDLAPRDLISRAMLTEIREGRGGRGDRKIDDFLFLDATHLGRETIQAKLPDIAEFSRTYLGVEPAEKPIPVQPTAHYAMGGIPTDLWGRVRADGEGGLYEGLYAAGECACVSVHGANRLGTNSLVDLVVFGRRAGTSLAEYAGGADLAGPAGVPAAGEADADPAREAIARLKDGRQGPHGGKIREKMADLMMERVGIYRNGKEMKKAVRKLKELRKAYAEVRVQDAGQAFNSDLQGILELGNLLDIALLTAETALNRTETRGGHAREDFPERDDEHWLKHSMATLKGGRVSIGYAPVDIRTWQPKPRNYSEVLG